MGIQNANKTPKERREARRQAEREKRRSRSLDRSRSVDRANAPSQPLSARSYMSYRSNTTEFSMKALPAPEARDIADDRDTVPLKIAGRLLRSASQRPSPIARQPLPQVTSRQQEALSALVAPTH